MSAKNDDELIECPECGEIVEKRVEECPNCGFPISAMFPEIALANKQRGSTKSEQKEFPQNGRKYTYVNGVKYDTSDMVKAILERKENWVAFRDMQKHIVDTLHIPSELFVQKVIELNDAPSIINYITPEMLEEKKVDFIITTTYNIEGYKIKKYIGLVHGEVALGTGIFSEFNAALSDVLGTTSNLMEGKLSKAKNAAQEQMISKSIIKGANALVGVDFDIMTLSNNTIIVSSNGTAVVAEKNQ